MVKQDEVYVTLDVEQRPVNDRETRPGRVMPVEYAEARKIRERNKISYRFAHWPIWIWVFFIAPGPLTSDLFERGFDIRMAAWLGVVLLGTGIAGLRGRLPGVEPRPYIIRFTEDRPNPLYRRVCYTFAWSAVVTFALLNAAGLVIAITTGQWYLRQMYDAAYFPIAATIWVLGALGRLPRVKASTKGEGHERRYFYGSVWAVCIAQPVLWLLWSLLPATPVADTVKLLIFLGVLAFVGNLAYRGRLPRTRPIVPGELAGGPKLDHGGGGKLDHPARWTACLRVAVRPGWSGGWARLWAGPDGAEARLHSQQLAKGGVRTPERQRRGGRACCVRGDSCRRSAPECGRDGSTGRAARRSAVQSRRSRSIR